MVNYAKGKIYGLYVGSDEEPFYVGSTCQDLSVRMASHRRATRNPKMKDYDVYQFMINVGVENCEIRLIEDCSCDRRDQLLKKEGETIARLKKDGVGLFNKFVPAGFKVPASGSYTNKNEYMREYYRLNPQAIKEYRSQKNGEFRERHNDDIQCECGGKYKRYKKADHEITKKHVEWLEENGKDTSSLRPKMEADLERRIKYRQTLDKDQLKEYRNNYYRENRERLLEWQKEYQADHKERKKETDLIRRQQFSNNIQCECGSLFKEVDKRKHVKTTKHVKWMESQGMEVPQEVYDAIERTRLYKKEYNKMRASRV